MKKIPQQKYQTKKYQHPELIELGNAIKTTLGDRPFGENEIGFTYVWIPTR